MSSQEAYEMAAQGLLGPEGKTVPILTGLRCTHFQPPNFTLGKITFSLTHWKSHVLKTQFQCPASGSLWHLPFSYPSFRDAVSE